VAPRADVVGGSFRDPAGFVFRRGGILYRQVNQAGAEDYDRLIESGLAHELVARGLLIPHEEVAEEPATSSGAHRILLPDEVPFFSYPYEWSFSQLKDAALATLEIQSVALDHDMSLRDASAYNIQFPRGRATLVDTLSFERRREGPWVAYRQFCSHFVAPLALMSTRDARLGLLLRDHIDGVPLDLASTLLPRRARMRPALGLHIVGHARSQRRHGSEGERLKGYRERFSSRAFRGLLESLRSGIASLDAPSGVSVWSDYYDEATHYTPEAAFSKEAALGTFIDLVRPSTVWDLGANTGRFSRLASARGIDTVAFDLDPFAVDTAYLETRARGDEHLLPLVFDLTNPSPGIGWANAERMTLAERGPADLVLALALVHHLAIGNNVPLPMVADHLAELGRHLVIEFVPKTDEKVRALLSSREDIFPSYSQVEFLRAFERCFEPIRREPVASSERTLFLMRRR